MCESRGFMPRLSVFQGRASGTGRGSGARTRGRAEMGDQGPEAGPPAGRDEVAGRVPARVRPDSLAPHRWVEHPGLAIRTKRVSVRDHHGTRWMARGRGEAPGGPAGGGPRGVVRRGGAGARLHPVGRVPADRDAGEGGGGAPGGAAGRAAAGVADRGGRRAAAACGEDRRGDGGGLGRRAGGGVGRGGRDPRGDLPERGRPDPARRHAGLRGRTAGRGGGAARVGVGPGAARPAGARGAGPGVHRAADAAGPFEAVELLRDPYVLMVQTGSSLATQAGGCAWGISPGSR